jgi:hypothetical protein
MTTEIKKSHEMNAIDAAIMISDDEFKTVEEINAFTADEDRKTVLTAKDKKFAEIEAALAAANKPPETPPADTPPPVGESATVTLAYDTCRYHENEEPRMFKAGDPIPGDWHESQKNLKRFWVVKDGAWARQDRG